MKTKAQAISWISYETKDLFWTAGLLLAAIVSPALLAHAPANQLLTGSIVNATLFLAAWRLGLINASVIAILPSTVALMRGLLPAPLATIIPLIILSNLILIAIYTLFEKKTFAFVPAAIIKFAFLYLVSLMLIGITPAPILMMLVWPQLITALVGGLFATLAIKTLLKK